MKDDSVFSRLPADKVEAIIRPEGVQGDRIRWLESELASCKTSLAQAQEALRWSLEMFEARDRMNAKVHCSPVRWSPVTERVRQALGEPTPSA